MFRFLSILNPAAIVRLFFWKIPMSKLINAYRALPTPANRVRLQKYLNRHMMAVCLATPEELAFLKTNEFAI